MAEIISILSGKGGTGKTTVAVNLAAAIEKREKTVLLVDLNIGSCGPDLLLGVDKRVVFNIVDVLNGNCKIIQAIMDLPRYGDMKYIPSGRTLTTAGIGFNKISKLLSMFRDHFDYVVVDVPSYPADLFFQMAKFSDRLLFVSDVSDLSVKNTVISKEKFIEETLWKSSLVLNKFRRDLVKEGLIDKPEEQVEKIGLPLLGVISESEDIFLQLETCDKIVDVKTQACQAFNRMAGRLMGERIPFDLKS